MRKNLHGQKLITVDVRRHEMGDRADLFVRPKQGTDYVWLSAVTKYMIDQGWHDKILFNSMYITMMNS